MNKIFYNLQIAIVDYNTSIKSLCQKGNFGDLFSKRDRGRKKSLCVSNQIFWKLIIKKPYTMSQEITNGSNQSTQFLFSKIVIIGQQKYYPRLNNLTYTILAK